MNYIDETAFRAAGHIKRLPEEEDLHSYVFENADGTRTAYIMNEPVKYVDSTGAVREKNLTLSTGKISGNSVLAATVNTNAFTVSATDYPTSLPFDLSQGVRFTYGEYTLNLRPETVNTATTALQVDGKMTYRNAFGSTAHLMYTPQLSGLKEDIVLTRYTGLNTFSFILDTDGLIPAEDAGGWYLWDGIDPEMQVRLGQVISYDAEGDFSIGTMTVTHQGGSTYRLTLTVDTAFLEIATYPVTVDPTLTVSDTITGSNAIEDIVVFEGAPNACYSSMQYNAVGDSTLGRGRTAFRLSGLYNSPIFQSATQVNSVNFYVFDYSSVAQTIGLYPLTNTTWTENTATWNNIGSYTTAYSKTNVNLPVNGWAAFDITELTNAWKSNAQPKEAGFVLISHNESVEKKVYSSENTNTERRPYVTLNYNSNITLNISKESILVDETTTLSVITSPHAQSVLWTIEPDNVVTRGGESNNNGIFEITLTGVALGTTTVTVSIVLANGTTETKTFDPIHVIMSDGVYLIKSESSTIDTSYGTFNLHAESLITDGNSMPEVYASTYSASVAFNNNRIYWMIQYLSNGEYVIRNMADYSQALGVVDNAVTLIDIGLSSFASISEDARWYIRSRGENVYEILSKGSLAMSMNVSWTIQSNTKYKYYDLFLHQPDNMSFELWSFVEVSQSVSDILFKDANGNLGKTFTKTIPIGSPIMIEDLGYEIITCSSNTPIQATLSWTSDDTSVASVNSQTGQITMKSPGKARITISATVDGKVCSIYFNLIITGLSNGVYCLRSYGSGYYAGLTETYDVTSEMRLICGSPGAMNITRFLITHVSNGYYVAYTYINEKCYYLDSYGNVMILTEFSSGMFPDTMLFRFIEIDGQYTPMPKSGEWSELAMTAPSSNFITLSEYNASNVSQQWSFIKTSKSCTIMQSQVYQLELDVLYDNKYLEKNDYDDMLDLLWDAENYYFAEFNILIDYDFPDLFNASADIRCTSTECTRLSHPTENAPHHGNFTSYANELCSYQPNADAVLVFSGHVLCDCNEGDTVASPTGGACVPSNSNRSFPVCLVGEYNTPKLLVLIHEIGHLFDAPDHYGEVGAYDTKIMNDNVNNSDHKAYIPNLPMGSKPYNEYCIYGENKNTVSTLTICDGCTYKIRNYISKLIAGTEQIG